MDYFQVMGNVLSGKLSCLWTDLVSGYCECIRILFLPLVKVNEYTLIADPILEGLFIQGSKQVTKVVLPFKSGRNT